MLLEHPPIIHLVNMVDRQYQHVLGLLRTDGINVLIDRIRRPLIPLITHSFHRRQYFDKLSHFPGHNVPPLADVPVQRKCLVLSEDVDPSQVRINAVGEGDINDAVDSAKCDRRFSPVTSEWVEPLACASGQQHSQRVFHLASGLMLVAIAIASTCPQLAPTASKILAQRENKAGKPGIKIKKDWNLPEEQRTNQLFGPSVPSQRRTTAFLTRRRPRS